MKANLCALVICLLAGCSGIRAYGHATDIEFGELCVVENPKVTVPLFEEDLVSQLEDRHLIVTVVRTREDCQVPYTLTYSALRSVGVVTKIRLSLYENEERIAYIDWDSGRSPMPPKIPDSTFKAVEFWQTAEALAALFGEIEVK